MRLTLSERLRDHVPDGTWRGLDPVIVGLVVALVIFGIAMLTSATNAVAYDRTGDTLYLVKRQLMFGLAPGVFLFLVFAFIDYRAWKPFAVLALIASYALMLLVFVPGVGVVINGSRNWLSIGGFQFQPSELVKLLFLVYLAAWFSSRPAGSLKDVKQGIVPFLVTLGSLAAIIVLQRDTGSITVIVGTAFLLFFIAGGSLAWFFGMILSGLAALWILIKISPYRAARFMAFLHPELDPKGVGYHINQAILAVASGGWLGLGFGKSRQKFLYLPEVEADSIFAVMGEELGFILCLVFLALYAALVWRCFMIARDSKDRFGALLAAGVGSWLTIQAGLNIASMIGLMPITGVTLPFVSHGGTSLAITLAAVGLVAGIPRVTRNT